MVASDIQRQWAKRGALLRLNEIEEERQSILKEFPDLKRLVGTSAALPGTEPRRRRVLSAANKRKMSAGMRKYWAERKAKEKAELRRA